MMGTGMNKYGSEAERQEAIDRGETSALQSSLMDGRKHYAVVKYSATSPTTILENLTGTDQDDLRSAEELARNWGPAAGAERIA